MTPAQLDELRTYLLCYVGRLTRGSDEDRATADKVCALLAALPPDPGGAMPEPWPGMLIEFSSKRRATVQQVEPSKYESAQWVVWAGDGPFLWLPDNVTEIRTPDGRVVWRAGGAEVKP